MVRMSDSDLKKSGAKWGRRILYVVTLIVLAWIGIFAILKWSFPNEFAITQARHILKTRYGIDIEIQRASIDPFARLEFQGITLHSSTGQPPLLYIESLKIGYDFASLIFHGELQIDQMLIVSPQVHIFQSYNGRWNIIELANNVMRMADLKASSDSIMAFPVKIALEKLDVENIAVSFETQSVNLKAAGALTGINMQIRGLSGSSMLDLKGNISIDMPEGRLDSRIDTPFAALFKTKIGGECAIVIDSNRFSCELEGEILPDSFAISQLQWQPAYLPEMSLSMKALFDQHAKSIILDPIVVSVDPIRLECRLETVLDTVVSWSFTALPVSLQLQSLFHMVDQLSLPALAQFDKLPRLAGTISLDSLSVTGSAPTPEMPDMNVALSGGFSVGVAEAHDFSNLPVSVDGIAASLGFSGSISNNELVDGGAWLSGVIRHVKYDSPIAPVELDSLFWAVRTSVTDAGKILQMYTTAGIGRCLKGTASMTSAATINVSNLLAQEPEAIEIFTLEGSLHNLDVTPFGNGGWGGAVSTDYSINADRFEHFDGSGSLTITNPWMMLQGQRLELPDLHNRLTLAGVIDVETRSVDISKLEWVWDDIADAGLQIHFQPPQYHLQLSNSHLDLAKLKKFLPADRFSQIKTVSLSGIVGCTGSVEGSVDNMSSLSFMLTPEIERLSVNISQPNAAAVISAKVDVSGDLHSITGHASVEIAEGGLVDLLPTVLHNSNVAADFRIVPRREFRLDSFQVEIPSLAFFGKGNADMDIAKFPPTGETSFDIAFKSRDRFALLDTISYSGITTVQGKILFEDSVANLTAELKYDDVCVAIGSLARLEGLSGRLPISQGIDLAAGSLISHKPSSMAHRALGLPSYWFLQSSYQATMPSFGTIDVDSISVMEYGISNISLDVTVANGYLEIPSMECDAYGGNLRGNLWVEINGISPDSIRTGIQMQVAGIRTSQIVTKSQRNPEESIICANGHLIVNGIPTSTSFDVEGNMDITRIGRGVAMDLLQMMDPEGKDEGIQSTQRYLKQGWGVKVFSFSIRDGFVYSYMIPTAPPPSKLPMYIASKIVRLPPQIAYGRIPLRFLLQIQGLGG
jgi:hypothetical protein